MKEHIHVKPMDWVQHLHMTDGTCNDLSFLDYYEGERLTKKQPITTHWFLKWFCFGA